MADAALGKFRTSDRTAVESGQWWGGMPVWVSVQRAGLRSATMFWPGSEAAIDGVRPWQWRRYAEDTRAIDNVQQVLQWLALPANQRPRFIPMYLDKLDPPTHDPGPSSTQAETARREGIAAIAPLLRGLRDHSQMATTNLLFVSDHGFDTVSYTHLDVYKRQAYAQGGAIGRHQPDGYLPPLRQSRCLVAAAGR